jgi:hypothetical protein
MARLQAQREQRALHPAGSSGIICSRSQSGHATVSMELRHRFFEGKLQAFTTDKGNCLSDPQNNFDRRA